MPGYLDWALEKLRGAPAGACAFWIDVDQLMSERNHGGLDEAELQSRVTVDGVEWQVVRFRANPFPARRALADLSKRTVVWCVGMLGDQSVDMTGFEDHFGRVVGVLDVSLSALAEDREPGLELPRGLGPLIAKVDVDLDEYLHYLRRLHRDTALSMPSATNALAGLLTNRETAFVASDPTSAVASIASALAAADSANVVAAVNLAVHAAAETNLRLKPLLESVASQAPEDVVALAYVATGLARQKVANLSSVLAADGWLSPDLRSAFDGAGGRWDSLPPLVNDDDLRRLAVRVEPSLKSAQMERLRDVLAESKVPIEQAVRESLPGIRLAVILARFEEFTDSAVTAAGPGRVTGRWAEELESLDQVAHGLRESRQSGLVPASRESTAAAYAQAFIESSASSIHLRMGRATYAFRSIESLFAAADSKKVARRLAAALESANAAIDEWDEGWRQILSNDIPGFMSHPRQGWRLSRDFADKRGGKTSWLLVFDGLRYDLWRELLVPMLRKSGWQVVDRDISFAFLPSITEVSRRTVVAGAREAARGNEETAARDLAERAAARLTYLVRSELFEKQLDEVEGWNVRVFSWPDKLVHSDIADLGTLVSQFEKWVQDELAGWFKRNVQPDSRVVVTTDHGFAELSEDLAIDVPSGAGEERNLPRVIAGDGELSTLGLVIPDAGRPATVATTRRWFRTPGARRWRFAHGGSSLHEVVVPFALLAPIKEGSALFEIGGLPSEVVLDEGSVTTIAFRVTISGGTDMFPTITVTGLTQLLKESIQRAEPTLQTVTVRGEEGLNRIIIRLQSGVERHDVALPVTVNLAKVKRAALDFDD